VLDSQGVPLAAVELAAPAGAYTRKQLIDELGPLVFATAERITQALD
jgi:DNA-binding IclR family transcriptional regulator